MKKSDIESLRQKYVNDVINLVDMNADPIAQFDQWFRLAMNASILEPNAMTLATVDSELHPDARIVLFKGVSSRGGFTFYTNYESKKAKDLTGHPFGAAVFCWLPMARQIRMRGHVSKLPLIESETYFHQRPRGSQIGAWISQQSVPIENRDILIRNKEVVEKRFEKMESIPLPDHWGGYELIASEIEFWQGNADRLHDRFRYALDGSQWQIERLSP